MLSTLNKNVYIVVSRYNENLKWLLEYPFTEFEYIIYNKGDDENFVKRNVKKIINIQNIGREGHTYLYHIIENYDNLPNINIFLPGSINSNIDLKYNKSKEMLINIINSNFSIACFIGYRYMCLKTQFENFHMNNYSSSTLENFKKNNESALTICKIRPYGKWYNYFFGNIQTHWYSGCGIFSIDKRDIIQHNKERYKLFIKTLEISSNPEAGHYIERSWGAMFFPLIYTKKINTKKYIN